MKTETIFSNVFSIPLQDIHDFTKLHDIPTWDSMTHMVLITALEEEFQIQLSGDEIADMQTVGDAKTFMAAHGASI